MLAFIQSLLDGILLGGIYGVISIGLSLVFGVLGIVNFAQAQFMMLGMYAAWFAWDSLGLDPILGVPLTGAVIFIIGYAIEKLLLQPVLKAPPVAQISSPTSQPRASMWSKASRSAKPTPSITAG